MYPKINGVSNPGEGLLSAFGDGTNNTITISRDAAGQVILLNGGATQIRGWHAYGREHRDITAFGFEAATTSSR